MVSKSLHTSTKQFISLSNFNWSISALPAATSSSPTFIALLPQASQPSLLNLETTLGIDAVNRFIICGNFNLPGNSPDTIDDELTELLHSTSFAQFVDAPTRYDTHHDKWSLLDLVISSSTSFLTSPISVTSSHEISDHSLLLANLSTRRQKPPRRSVLIISKLERH